ncbi:MAG: glycoside hydrolase family 5 protein [Saprospiraceae bacterium]|nr:glycoside hydrolase family 5 protein [Saprospiraceae bacterium]
MKGVLRRFKDDERIVLWDLYNEPGNNHLPDQVFPLVKKVFQWAREINPTQPVTVGIWRRQREFQEVIDFCLNNSDIISFHNYGAYEGMAKDIANFKSYGKPLVCSEYLARGNNSTFETILPLLQREQVAAINWGFVDGKTQTKYPWNHPLNVIAIEPWHHEIYQKDGTPYRQSEVALIQQLTGRAN